MNYLDYSSNLSSRNIILYTIEDKIINNGGRGRSYVMIIRHGTNISKVSITSKEFVLIDEGELPVLYMTKGTEKIFSQSIIKRNIRISILFFIFSIVMLFIPWK